MGSWNSTCGVSQLPIVSGDDVAIFIMKKSEYDDSNKYGCVHSDNFYSPISLAMIGKYNDYGRVTEVKADKRVVDIIYGKQKSYNDVGEVIDKQSKEKELFVMLVHLDIYKKIINNFGSRKEFFTKGLYLKEHFRNELIKHIQMKRKDRLKNKTFNPELDYAYRSFINSMEFYHNFYNNDEIYDDVIEEDSLIDSMVDFLIFRHAMQTSRKLWTPQSGQGSQEKDYEMVKIVGEFAIKKENEDDEW